MSAQTLEKKIARRQRGIRIRDNDAFVRAGRIVRIVSAGRSEVSYRFADGEDPSQSRQDVLSRHLTRIPIKRGETPSNSDLAKSIGRSKSFSKREKISLLRGLQKKSSGVDRDEVSLILKSVRGG